MSLSPRHSLARSFWRGVRCAMMVIVVAMVGFVVYLYLSGFPPWLLRAVQRKLRSDAFAFKADAARLDWRRGLVLEDARIFRLRRVGAPAAEAEEVALQIDWPAWLRGESFVRSVRVVDGALRPQMASRPAAEHGRESASSSGAAPALDMHLEFVRCQLDGVELERATCHLLGRGDELRFEGIEIESRTDEHYGTVRGSVVYHTRKRTVDVHGESQLDPRTLLPLVRQHRMHFLEELIGRFRFDDLPPRVRFGVSVHPGATAGPVTVNASFWMRNGSYRNVDFLRADGDVEVIVLNSTSRTTVDSLFIVRPEGNAAGSFTVDTARNQVRFDVRSSFHPQAAADMIGILGNRFDLFTFNGGVVVTGQGVVDYREGDDTDLRVQVDVTDTQYSNLVVQAAQADVMLRGSTLTVTNAVAKIYEGDLAGWGVVEDLGSENTNSAFRMGLKLEKSNFEMLVESLAGVEDQEYQGELGVTLDLSGEIGTNTASTLAGNGAVRIYDGRVFMLPVFGGLSHYMTKLIPGLDFVLRQTDANVEFDIANGCFSSEDVQIRGDVISLSGKGEYRFDNRLDFSVQIRLLKQQTLAGRILKPVFYPISKLFEFRLRGTVDKPSWYLTNFSSDLLEKLGLRSKEDSSP